MPVLHLFSAPPAAHGSIAAAGYEIGSGRLVPTVAAVVGLTSMVVGGLALARSGRPGGGNGRAVATVALVAALISVAVGGLHLANVAGGPGTGNGAVGAIVALVAGVIGMAVSGLAVARSRGCTRSRTSVPDGA